jgi:hypothetical protein
VVKMLSRWHYLFSLIRTAMRSPSGFLAFS